MMLVMLMLVRMALGRMNVFMRVRRCVCRTRTVGMLVMRIVVRMLVSVNDFRMSMRMLVLRHRYTSQKEEHFQVRPSLNYLKSIAAVQEAVRRNLTVSSVVLGRAIFG